MKRSSRLCAFAAALVLSGASIDTARAEFTLKGKTFSVYIGSSPGGGYDLYGRLLAQYIGKHLPGNPTVITRNMPNGSGREVFNYIYNIAPKDGAAIAITLHDVPLDPLLNGEALKVDPLKVTWLGSMNSDINVCVSWNKSRIKTLADVQKRQMLVGATGPSSANAVLPKLLNAVAGTKFHIVEGYPGGSEVALAMQRGEIDGTCGVTWDQLKSQYKSWIADKLVNPIVQLGLSPAPDLSAPFVMDLVHTAEQRQLAQLILGSNRMGRPIFAPPDVSPEIVASLRKAFDETMRDPEMAAEGKKTSLGLTAMNGEAVARLVASLYRTPASVVARARGLLGGV